MNSMGNSQAIKDAVALLKKWGLDVQVHPQAETNGHPYTYQPHAVIRHHTASNRLAIEQQILTYVVKGSADLPGPLCQFYIARDGTIWATSYGYAYHAGKGGPWRDIPLDNANRYSVGVEVDNDGKGEPYPAVQLHAARCLDAALLIVMGRDVSWLIGHKEWAPLRKVDPLLDMDVERLEVAAIIREKTSPQPRVRTYAVKAGDTLWGIAKRFLTTVAQLVKTNKLPSDVIQPGQELTVEDQTQVVPVQPSTKPHTLPVLQTGQQNAVVKQLQSELNRVFPAYSQLPITGFYGELTEKVIKEFQARAGIKVNGVVNPVTWDHLIRNGVQMQ